MEADAVPRRQQRGWQLAVLFQHGQCRGSNSVAAVCHAGTRAVAVTQCRSSWRVWCSGGAVGAVVQSGSQVFWRQRWLTDQGGIAKMGGKARDLRE